jgi:hypothetical protein
MYADEPTNPIQLSGVEAVVSSQLDGSSQNLQVLSSRSTCTCAGSLQSKLVKNTRYGPGIPLIRGIQEGPPSSSFAQQRYRESPEASPKLPNAPLSGGGIAILDRGQRGTPPARTACSTAQRE